MSEELSGLELRIAALKADNWTWVHIDDYKKPSSIDPSLSPMTIVGGVSELRRAGKLKTRCVCCDTEREAFMSHGDPCESSIAAAWELLEKWRKTDHDHEIRIESDNLEWTCVLLPWLSHEGIKGIGASAPEAICRAIVAAAKGEK